MSDIKVSVFFFAREYSLEALLDKMPTVGDVLELSSSQTYGQGNFPGTIKITVGKRMGEDLGFQGRKKLPTFECSISSS